MSETTVEDLVFARDSRELIFVDVGTTVGHTMNVMKLHDVLSVPVVEKKSKTFLGFVDVLDIACWVLKVWRSRSVAVDEIHFPADDVFEKPVEEILNLSHANPIAYIPANASLYELIQLFLDPKAHHRLHRVAVTDEKDEIINVVSQSDLVSFADSHINDLPEIRRDALLGDLRGLIHTPIMVRIDAPFIDALECLCRNKISGLALVDHEYKLSGNFSVSDLRGMNPLAFDFFYGSTLQFMCKGTSTKAKITQSLGPGNTFGEAIKRLKEEHIHRLYIVTETAHPVGFLSLIDVIARLVIPLE